MIECFAVFDKKDEILNPSILCWKLQPSLHSNLQSAYDAQKVNGGIIAKVRFSNLDQIVNALACAYTENSINLTADVLEFISVQKT